MLYETLRNTIDTTPIIDDHAHIGRNRGKADSGAPLPLPSGYLPPAALSYGFPYLEALHTEIVTARYGIAAQEVNNPARMEAFNRIYREKKADFAGELAFFLEKGNIEHVIANGELPAELAGNPRFSLLPLVDGLLYPFAHDYLHTRPLAASYLHKFETAIAPYQAAFGLPADFGYEEYMAFADWFLKRLKDTGCKGYKFLSPYVRSMHFPKPAEDGAALFAAAKAGDTRAYDTFQSFMAWHIFRTAVALDMPIQVHTALIDAFIDYTDPRSMQNFLEDPETYPVKLVLLHCGYPLYDNAVAMAMANNVAAGPNQVCIELSGRVMFANHPKIIAKNLRKFLEFPDLWGKILYGSDALLDDRVLYTAARTGRDAVYFALAGMLDDGILNEPAACSIAKGILRNNAIRVYNLPLEVL